MLNNHKAALAVTFGLGALLSAFLVNLLATGGMNENGDNQEVDEPQPLYWVAPMDANYRREQPGKSPMGMDLIPVYEEANVADEYGPGAVTIAPHVINNLGVRTAPVTVKHMNHEILTVGYVQYDQDQLIHIHPRVDGWIEKLFVKAAGNPVSQGQPLYTLYSPQLVNAQEELLIALKRNNQSLITAAKERLRALHLSNAFIDNLIKTRKVEQTITFYARQAGVLADLKIREGFFVKPGNTLLSIAKLDQVWVEAEVFERDAALIRQGLPVTMTLSYLPAREWQGVVDYVYPTLNSETRTLRVRLKFDNNDHQLKPNMFAQVSIFAEQADSTKQQSLSIIVPKEAVIRTGKQDRVVLALGEGQFKSIAVTIGRVDQNDIEILSGLTQNDTVVTSAQFLIDSESSKTSDFMRMTFDETPSAVWMEGEINSVMVNHRMANISHNPVEEWDWPEMTMDFTIADSVDIEQLKAGQSLHFEVTKLDGKSAGGGYEVTGIHIMTEPQMGQSSISSATVNGVVNAIDSQSRIINISRDAIEKWNRPAATMDFIAADSIDLTTLSVGQAINFTFEIHDDFIIVAINAMPDMTMPETELPETEPPESGHSRHMNHSMTDKSAS